MEKSVKFENKLGVKELRELNELSRLNNALTEEEFMQIVLIYKRVIDRLVIEAKEQGVNI